MSIARRMSFKNWLFVVVGLVLPSVAVGARAAEGTDGPEKAEANEAEAGIAEADLGTSNAAQAEDDEAAAKKAAAKQAAAEKAAAENTKADDDQPKINAGYEFQRANRLASAGAVTRSIPHYEKVLQAAPKKYPQSYFNLAEVYRFKGKCRKAVMLYGAYLSFAAKAEDVADAKKGAQLCLKDEDAGQLSVTIEPKAPANLTLEGYLVGQGLDEMTLVAGDYHLRASAADHIPETVNVTIAADAAVDKHMKLEKKLFYGSLRLDVDQKGASVKVTPKALDSPKAADDILTFDSPTHQAHKLATGHYFIEVTKPGYDRWIRNVAVSRGQETSATIHLTEALPDAIR